MRRIIFLLLLFLALPAKADELQPVYIQLDETSAGEWSVIWRASARSTLGRHARLRLPENCLSSQTASRSHVSSSVRRAFTMRCDGSLDGQVIGLKGLEASQTDALLRIAPLESGLQTLRLTPKSPTISIAIAEPMTTVETASTYTIIGVEHIVFGFDHLLFVLSLVLLLSRFKTLFWAITAFTLAHSVTLIGTTLGYFGLPSRPVEAIIALSIVFLALEIIKAKPGELRLSEKSPWLVAFAFGLLHGFGFAGALAEIGLPNNDRIVALLGFNIGVELGQLFIVAISAVILWGLKSLLKNAHMQSINLITKIAPAYVIGSIATYWLIERVVFI